MRIQTKTYLLAWIALATGIIASTPARAADGEARRFYSAVPGGGDRTMDYEVKEGDTLFHIAERFLGSPYRADVLAKNNGIADPLHLKAGTHIKVPAVEASILYSIEKLTPAGELLQYGGNDAMSAGDRFFVRISANADGYLYLFNRSGNGRVSRIFPASKRPQRIKAFSEYLLPAKGAFQLDRMQSDEEIWVVLASQALSDLDAALDSGVLETAKMQAYDSARSAKGIVLAGDPDDESDLLVEGARASDRLLVVHTIKIRRR